MDVGEDFLLKWNDHHSLFFKGAEKLLENEEFTDVILAAGERFFSAHRLVLSICSPFFQKLFKHLGNQKTVVYLKDIEAEHLELLLEYMYKGEIKVQESELVNVLSSAQSLEVKGLTDSGKNKKSKSATPPTSGIGAKRSAANSTVEESEVDSDVASSRKRANKNIKTTEKHVSPPPIKAIKQENNFTENDRASKTHRLSDSTSEDHGGVIATLATATSDYGDEDDAAVEGVEGGFDASAQYEELGYEDGEYFGEEGGIPPPPHLMATEEDRVKEDVLPVLLINETNPLPYEPQIIDLKKEELDINDDKNVVGGYINYAAGDDTLIGGDEHELLVDGVTASSMIREVEQEVTLGVLGKVWRCGLCSYQCTLKGNMKKHLLVHSGAKPHQCSLCVKSFADASNLRRHLKFVHLTNKKLA